VDATGNVYVADAGNHLIRKITPAGVVSTVAGRANVSGSADGTGSAALFSRPTGVAVGPTGDIFAADTGNNTIRRITPAGVVTTLAGSAGFSGSTDGNGSAARFSGPRRLTVDASGVVFVADTSNNSIRKVTATGDVSTLASGAGLSGPEGIAVDLAGNTYVAENYGAVVHRITAGGSITTLAGLSGAVGANDGIGSSAYFYSPKGMSLDAAGNLYLADWGNNTIRKVTLSGIVTTVAGLAEQYAKGYADGTGAIARFRDPQGVAVDSTGNVYVSDMGNHVIRKITPTGVVSTLAGSPDASGNGDGTGNAARFLAPDGLAIDPSGMLYTTDSGNGIRKITPAGVVTTLATGVSGRGLAVDAAGTVYVVDLGQNAIRKVTPAGVVSLLAGGTYGIPVTDGVGTGASFYFPRGATVDAAGTLYVADSANNTIRKVTPAGEVTTLAGMSFYGGWDDGAGANARFNYPIGIAVDSSGNLFVCETNSVRKITPAGNVSTLAGPIFGAVNNPDALKVFTFFQYPSGIAVDAAGTLYLVQGQAILKGQRATAPAITAQPRNASVATGGSVQLSVTATGAPESTYQWYYNGNPFAGATGSTLSFSNANAADAGDYTVVATNALGSVTSAKATLTVSATTPPPSSGGDGGSGGGGGGGAIEGWFVLTLLALGATRRLTGRRPA